MWFRFVAYERGSHAHHDHRQPSLSEPRDARASLGTRCRADLRGQRATIVGTPGPDILRGTTRSDVIVGLGGNDRIYGGKGNDLICGGFGVDVLSGGDGSDSLIAGAPSAPVQPRDGWADVLIGGAGSDVLTAQEAQPTSLGAGFEIGKRLVGGPGNDTLRGTAGPDLLDGGVGSDYLVARSGGDTVLGRDGDDLIATGEPGNRPSGSGSCSVVPDLVAMGPGDDRLSSATRITAVPACENVGGNWSGLALALDFSTSTAPVAVDLSTGTAVGQGADSLRNLPGVLPDFFSTLPALKVVGTDQAYVLTGMAGNQWLVGGAGDDTLNGLAGADDLIGGDGDDVLHDTVPGGPDLADGGAGDDVFDVIVDAWGTRMPLGPETVAGGDGFDTVASMVANPTAPMVRAACSGLEAPATLPLCS